MSEESTSVGNQPQEGLGRQVLLGAQMLFVAFGSLVLVPILTGLSSSVALFTAGAGTLVFQIVTRRSVPVFLASSFAFIAPIIYGSEQWGIPATMSGLFAAGLVYVALSFLVRWKGQRIIDRVLPPIVVGPVIMVIGLSLAPIALNMAQGKTSDGAVQLVPFDQAVIIALVSVGVTVLVTLLGRGMFKLVPILFGIVSGYVVSVLFGVVDFSAISAAPIVAMPPFTFPEFNIEAILFILPVAIAPAIEHIGDIAAISGVAKKDFFTKPGLKNTLLGDGLATSLAALFGGPPNTTYSEVTGAVALTKAFNPAIMTFAAIWAVILSFSGTLGAVLATIPVPVMGGIEVILFGAIAVVGVSTLLKVGDELTEARNLIIASVVLVIGIGGLEVGIGDFAIKGIGLCAIVAILLNLLLPQQRVEQGKVEPAE
ncbi:uracil-xanthine permease family protein [uncultured Cohaesibacter sp.]|uniref:uracil-xanthine permease family protein n=1 Tax=uncultured Cohaesibacter sp. TaxID=1002546 RepID=UPI002AA92375|nr:uracil-xanthine permease family protein [uncultured Cohaesibacter sp.]